MSSSFINILGRVGPQAQADGTLTEFRASKDSSMVVAPSTGWYQEAVYRGNVFFAANQAAVTFSVGLTTTTAVGLIVSNPLSSGKLVVPVQVEYTNNGTVVGTVGLSVMSVQTTNVTHTTALTVQNAYTGAAAGVAKADSGSALPAAPVVWKTLYSVLTTNTAGNISPAVVYDLSGSLILPPGAAVAVLATAATTGFPSMTWLEIPI